MPNFHGFGLSLTMHTPLTFGCTSILVPKFNGKKLDTLIKKTNPTVILGVPTLYEAMANCNNEQNENNKIGNSAEKVLVNTKAE